MQWASGNSPRLRAFGGLSAVVAAAWVMEALIAQDRGEDYLSPGLRERVEALKVEAPQSSADAGVLAARLATLWEWANAYSLTGGPVPGGFPQLTANANRGLRRLPAGGAQLPIDQISGFIAQFTREFQIKDESPEALGSLKLSSNGPFRAGEFVTISQTYTVGEMPMAPGGGIVVGRSRPGAFRRPALTATAMSQCAVRIQSRDSRRSIRGAPGGPSRHVT